MVSDKAKVKGQVVGYRGSGPLMTDLIGGQVPVAFDTLDSLLPQGLGAGKIRILAASGARRSSFAPDVPTFRGSRAGPGANGWNTFAPKGMPKAQVDKLAQAIQAVMRDPDTQSCSRRAN